MTNVTFMNVDGLTEKCKQVAGDRVFICPNPNCKREHKFDELMVVIGPGFLDFLCATCQSLDGFVTTSDDILSGEFE